MTSTLTPSRTVKEVTTMRRASRPGRPLTSRATTALRKVTGAFRHANDQLLLVSELIFRPAGATRRHQPPDPPAKQDVHPVSSDRAA